MKQLYSIKIYRSFRFKIFHFFLLIFLIGLIYFKLYALIKVGFFEYFFPNQGSYFADSNFPFNCLLVAEYFLTLAVELFFTFLLALSVFCNRILVFDDKLIVFFAPRMFYRLYKSDISWIGPIDNQEITHLTRLVNYNFSSEHLYKFVCYDDEFIISSKDFFGMQRLMEDINSRGNRTEKEEVDYNPLNLNREEKFVVVVSFLVLVDLIDLFRSIL